MTTDDHGDHDGGRQAAHERFEDLAATMAALGAPAGSWTREYLDTVGEQINELVGPAGVVLVLAWDANLGIIVATGYQGVRMSGEHEVEVRAGILQMALDRNAIPDPDGDHMVRWTRE